MTETNTAPPKEVVFSGPGLEILTNDQNLVIVMDESITRTLPEDGIDRATQEVIGMEWDIIGCANFYKADETLWRLLGYEVEKSGSSIRITAPTLARLNDIRLTKLAETGVNTGTFIEYGGDYIEPSIYVEYFAKRQIPIATKPIHLLHDSLLHAFCFSLMSERIFNNLVSSAQRAIETRDPEEALEVTKAAENLSADILDGSGRVMVETEYRKIMDSTLASSKGPNDELDQVHIIERLHQLVASKVLV